MKYEAQVTKTFSAIKVIEADNEDDLQEKAIEWFDDDMTLEEQDNGEIHYDVEILREMNK